MSKFKYNAGDQLGPNHILMISRDFTKGSGNWYGTFECPLCGKHFQTKIKAINAGTVTSCGCKSNKSQIIGETIGKLTIIKELKKEHSRNAYWICRCSNCGKEFEITTTDFHNNRWQNCPHDNSLQRGRPPENLTNKKFGKLTVLEYMGHQKWKCQCECRNLTYVRSDCLKNGQTTSCGCVNSKGEQRIGTILKELNIKYIPQKTFNTCRFKSNNNLAKFDFYLPDYNIIIEYNGIQHYEYKETGWNNQKNFIQTQQRDKEKIYWCKENKIKLIIIPYTDFNSLNKEYLLSKIVNQ